MALAVLIFSEGFYLEHENLLLKFTDLYTLIEFALEVNVGYYNSRTVIQCGYSIFIFFSQYQNYELTNNVD